jgi:predicted DNA binding protein
VPPIQVTLKVKTEGSFTEITRRFQSSSIYLWCNRENDVSELRIADPTEVAGVMEALRAAGEKVSESGEGRLIIPSTRCTCTNLNSVHTQMDELNILSLLPIVYHSGEETHQIVAFRREDLEALFQRIETAGWSHRVTHMAELRGGLGGFLTLPVDAVAGSLTEKQADALLTAYRSGYYEFPRRRDVQEIAEQIGAPRTTYREHLAKAENKLIRSLAPYLEMRSRGSG